MIAIGYKLNLARYPQIAAALFSYLDTNDYGWMREVSSDGYVRFAFKAKSPDYKFKHQFLARNNLRVKNDGSPYLEIEKGIIIL